MGWAMANHLHTELVVAALDMALGQRRPASVIHHSDQSWQYTSLAFGERCSHAGVVPSMGSVGDCYDNAMAESFFASLECELLDRVRFDDYRHAQERDLLLHPPAPAGQPLQPQNLHCRRDHLRCPHGTQDGTRNT